MTYRLFSLLTHKRLVVFSAHNRKGNRMISIQIRKGETMKQALIRLQRLMLSEWGRKGGSKGGAAKSEAAKKREAMKRKVRSSRK
jgi:hypothetical protein